MGYCVHGSVPSVCGDCDANATEAQEAWAKEQAAQPEQPAEKPFTIEIVDDQPCPECGAMWMTPDCDSGNPLDFPNRPKVGDEDGTWWWRCYNPACRVGYYEPFSGQVEYVASKEES